MSKKSLLILFSLSFLISGFCPASEFEFDNFLGTLGGIQIRLPSAEKGGKTTYSRTFKPFGPLNVRDDISKRHLIEGGYQAIGEEYRVGSRGWWSQSAKLPGGGFFLNLKEFKYDKANMFSTDYT